MIKKIINSVLVLFSIATLSSSCSSEDIKHKNDLNKGEPEERNVKSKIEIDQLHCIGDSIYYKIKDNKPYTGEIYDDTIFIGNAINGKKEGKFYSYNFDGKIYYEAMYKDGKLNGLSTSYFENGNIDSESNYKDGKRDGEFKLYLKNGELSALWTFKDGIRNGTFKLWNKEGVLITEGTQKNGFPFGIYKEYNEDGSLKYKANFDENGEMLSCEGECY